MELACATWLEQEQRWSTAGFQESGADTTQDDLVCKTTHLTVFAAIWVEVVRSVSCANLLLFSSAGVERVFSAAGKTHDNLRKSMKDSTLEARALPLRRIQPAKIYIFAARYGDGVVKQRTHLAVNCLYQ